jgi:hypothetical protein
MRRLKKTHPIQIAPEDGVTHMVDPPDAGFIHGISRVRRTVREMSADSRLVKARSIQRGSPFDCRV